MRPISVLLGVMAALYRGMVRGALTIDLGIGRRHRDLGPLSVTIEASRDVVFDVIETPYLGRQTRAVAEKIQVLEMGADMVLAAHRTPLRGRRVATTVETVRFSRPERIDFRLVRGPVPHVVEEFVLTDVGGETRLDYHGEMGTDLWWLGALWGARVARVWDHVVAESLEAIKTESQRRARITSPGAATSERHRADEGSTGGRRVDDP
ncbi:MAG: SRPBCC family protein [Actinobacteria bacterium]|nr:SRPBCC family protein [Actinomycetota bacterium]